jgi:hypothetical protein
MTSTTTPATTEALRRLCQDLIDAGRLVEAGWVSLRIAAIPRDASTIQLNEMRTAFFAGAQHLFVSIMRALENGEEPTDADLRRMDLINDELQKFIDEFSKARGLRGSDQ